MAEGEKKYLGFADIQAAQDQRIEEVEVPEWGGIVKVCSITSGERAKLENAMFTEEVVKGVDANGKETLEVRRKATDVNFRALLVGKCLINGDGRRIFDDDEVKILDQRNALVIDRLFAVAQKLNALQAGAVEEAKKD